MGRTCPQRYSSPPGATSLVQAGIRRHGGQQRVAAPLATQHRGPQLLWLLREDLVAAGRLHDPGVLGQLVLELAGAPAGVAREDARAPDGALELVGLVRVGADEAEV